MASNPSAQYTLTLRVQIDHRPGMLGKVASAIGEAGATIGAVDLVAVDGPYTVRDITVQVSDAADWPRLTAAVDAVAGARVLDTTDRTFMLHLGDKIEIANKHPVRSRDDLSMAYTPGVARVCSAIRDEPDRAYPRLSRRPARDGGRRPGRVAQCADPDRPADRRHPRGPVKRRLAGRTNPERRSGTPVDVLGGADLLIGLSGCRVVPAEALERTNTDPIVFHGQPGSRGLARGGAAPGPQPGHRPARTTPTRSTTSCASPASSAGRSMPAPATSPPR